MVKTGREESQWERDVTPVAACRGTDFSVSFGTVFFSRFFLRTRLSEKFRRKIEFLFEVQTFIISVSFIPF